VIISIVAALGVMGAVVVTVVVTIPLQQEAEAVGCREGYLEQRCDKVERNRFGKWSGVFEQYSSPFVAAAPLGRGQSCPFDKAR
jgi:hypothetical protein